MRHLDGVGIGGDKRIGVEGVWLAWCTWEKVIEGGAMEVVEWCSRGDRLVRFGLA